MDSRLARLLEAVGQMDTPDAHFLALWAQKLVKAKRVWVAPTKKTGTGPLVLVGAEAPRAGVG